MEFDCQMYSNNTTNINLKGAFSWNKMCSLKALTMIKRESRTSLHAVQYK